MHHFSSRQWVPFPLDEVFAFFSAPENLARLMPPALATRIERIEPEPAAGATAAAGTVIHLSFRPIPFVPVRVGWVAQIVEYEPPSHFCDAQREGPFAHFIHRHGFRTEMRDGVCGTLVTDEIEFEPSFGVAGRLAGPLVRLQLGAAFAARRRRLTALLRGQASGRAAAPRDRGCSLQG